MELQIITSNVMEGTGFKSFLSQNKVDYEVKLQLLSANSSNYDELKNSVNKNAIVIIDTDSLEDETLFNFLLNLYEVGIKCIIYSRLSTPGLMIKARELSMAGYVSKNSKLSCLLNCLDVIELGGTYYDSCFSDLLKNIMNFEKMLSTSEKRLFEAVLLFNNKTIKDLSEILNISKHTIEVHLSNLYKKAKVSSFNGLIEKFSL